MSGTGFTPAFPAPAPPTIPIAALGLNDSDGEISLEPSMSSSSGPGHQHVVVMPAGRENDEALETLSIHERLVDEAHARSSEATASVPVEPTLVEPEIDFLQTEHGKILQERLSTLVAAFRDRSQKAKQMIMQPPPPEKKPDPPPGPSGPPKPPGESATKSPVNNDKEPEKKPAEEKKKPPPPPPSKPVVAAPPPPVRIPLGKKYYIPIPEWFFKIPRPRSFDAHSRMYLAWLLVVSVAFIYNAIVIPYRAAFANGLDDPYFFVWLAIDYTCDAIYLADLVIWKPSIRTYINGIEELDKKEITRKYITGDEFKLDLFCLMPLDFLYLIPDVGIKPLLRLPRLLKIFGYWEFLDRIDQVSPNPYNYYFRVLRSFSYMMYLIHANACVYYYFSFTYDFSSQDPFVFNNDQPQCQANPPGDKCTFPGHYNAYIFCFFFSVSMVTIIGNFNFPGTVAEMLYSTVLWFVGVFIFATIVGQIRDVLKAMTRHEDEFYEIMDAIVEHMHTLKIPKELQDRVRSWLLFNWEQQKTIDERHLLDGLPNKLRSDLAMEVHFMVIHKVALFKGIDKKVIEELLLRLRPTVYLAQDYICRKGEIGKEMYIVKSGMLEVVLPDGRVAVTLGPGSVFGEISLLSLAGGNRRTADVRSKGFTNLYTLSKADLNDVMKDYPETLVQLRDKAQELMNKGKPEQIKPPTPPPVEVIPTRPPTPEMVRVALSILKADSAIRRRISQSAAELTSFHTHEHELTDNEDVEIALPTDNHAGIDHLGLRTHTPLPNPDVTPEILARHHLVDIGRKPSTDSEGTTKSAAMRRKRSRVNEPSQLSSSDSEDESRNSRRGSSAARNRRRRVPRPASQLTTSSLASKEVKGFSDGNANVDVHDTQRTPTPTREISRAHSPQPPARLTNLKRRFTSAPRVHPLDVDAETTSINEPEMESAVNRQSVFAFERKPSFIDKPGGLTVKGFPHRMSTTSYSDYEFTNYSDNFAGVTFSSGTDTP